SACVVWFGSCWDFLRRERRCIGGRRRSRLSAVRICELTISDLRFVKPVTNHKSSITESRKGGSNSVVESQPSKLLVAGSIPVSRSKRAVSNWQSAISQHSALGSNR